MTDTPSDITKALLAEIEAFLAETGMGASYFGKAAVKNSELVRRLRDGRGVELRTAEAVRGFIAERRERLARGAA